MNVLAIPTDEQAAGDNNTGLRQRRFVAPTFENGASNMNNINTNNNEGREPAPDSLSRGRIPSAPSPPSNPHVLDAQQQQRQTWKSSHVYCFISAVLAVLAIITSAASPAASLASRNHGSGGSSKYPLEIGKESHPTLTDPALKPSAADAELIATSPVASYYMMDTLDTEWLRHAMDFLFANPSGHISTWIIDATENSSRAQAEKEHRLHQQQPLQPEQQQTQNQQQKEPWWKLSWLVHSQKHQTPASKQHQHHQAAAPSPSPASASWWQRWLDPSILQAKPFTVTDLIDKVSTSTPRLLAIANLLLALTYQMHAAVADLFLGVGVYPPPGEWAMTGRERLGSFLVFKLLLISAVAEPDTLDLLILLSWYTLLSFLRSLAHLAAATTSHTSQSGQPPRTGVLQLLLVVLTCDFAAAAACVALFQLAGVGKVVLLTCDCALLAVEVLGHILKHGRQVLEEMHENRMSEMEEQQLQIHSRLRSLERQQRQQPTVETSRDEESDRNSSIGDVNVGNAPRNSHNVNQSDRPHIEEGLYEVDGLSLDSRADDGDGITTHQNNQRLLMEDSRRLDQAIDTVEVAHSRRLAILDTTIFFLQLLVHAITVGHFLHIWYLHGIQFTLIDGVLALHLHSALSAASKQIAGRRNLHRIARNLDGMFPNASDMDLKRAHGAGDVCCICLGAMSVGSVKKVGCGHLYHTNCLREVIERAISIEAAKCPLCRASVVDGSHPGHNSSPNGQDQGNGGAAGGNGGVRANAGNGVGNNAVNGPRLVRPNDGMIHRGERALFRFSTEGILPTWIPLPAFSFEVVRRPTRQEHTPPVGNNNNNLATLGGLSPQRNNANANNNDAGLNENSNNQQSFLRRWLWLPMSPEEEGRALAQLVDMFPQYDRADLLRELRDRGSAESVVESVLLGVFSGPVRGSAGGDSFPASANIPVVGGELQGETPPATQSTTLPEDTMHQQRPSGVIVALAGEESNRI